MAKTTTRLRQVAERGYWREADGRAVVEAWRASGDSLTVFAHRHGVRRARLARWLKRLEASRGPALHPVRLVNRPAATAAGVGVIELRWADGTRVLVPPGFAAEDLHRVLAVLAESMPC